jgi:hypothetical protein
VGREACRLLTARGQSSAIIGSQLTGRVVDEAHLLRPKQILDRISKSEALEAQTGRQLVIATPSSRQISSGRFRRPLAASPASQNALGYVQLRKGVACSSWSEHCSQTID